MDHNFPWEISGSRNQKLIALQKQLEQQWNLTQKYKDVMVDPDKNLDLLLEKGKILASLARLHPGSELNDKLKAFEDDMSQYPKVLTRTDFILRKIEINSKKMEFAANENEFNHFILHHENLVKTLQKIAEENTHASTNQVNFENLFANVNNMVEASKEQYEKFKNDPSVSMHTL